MRLLALRRLAALVVVVPLLGAVPSGSPPIVEAAKARDWAGVAALIGEGADVGAPAPDGATALHWAAYWDEVAAADLLIRAGADPNTANDLGATALWLASMNGSVAMVSTLLEAGADPNAALRSGESPVMTAARTGDAEVLELLLRAGADPNVSGSRGQTALMWAAAQRHPDAVQTLVAHGADVRARSDSWSQVMAVPPHSDPANQQRVPHGDDTPLLFAARVGDVASARVLLDAGADPDDADAWGVSATVYAAHSGFHDLVALLLQRGADPDAAGAGFSALHLAVMRRDLDMARTLLDRGADPNARITNWTPTRRASHDWSIHPALVGATPFWLAARFSEPALMRLLVERGADPLFVHRVAYVGNAGAFGAEEKNEANTALMAAAGMGGPRSMSAFVELDRPTAATQRLQAVRLAVELGVDLAARDLDGHTAAEGTRDTAVRGFLEELAAKN